MANGDGLKIYHKSPDSDEKSVLVGVRGFESHPRHHTFFKIQVRCRVHFRRNVTVRGFNAGEKGK